MSFQKKINTPVCLSHLLSHVVALHCWVAGVIFVLIARVGLLQGGAGGEEDVRRWRLLSVLVIS